MTTSQAAVQREFDRLKNEHHWDPSRLKKLPDGTYSTPAARPQSAFDYEQSQLTLIADTSWWFRARNELIESIIHRHAPSAVLWDIGGGVGTVAQHLGQCGKAAIVIEPDTAGARAATTKNLVAVAGSLQDLELPDHCIASVGMFDVIEHLEDPVSMLAEVHRVMKPGGKLFVSVPALPALWSYADVTAGHFRRYTTTSLRAEAGAAGLMTIETGYWFSSLVAPMFAMRALPYRLGRRPTKQTYERQLKPSSDRVVRALIAWESATAGMPIPGTSVYAVLSPATQF